METFLVNLILMQKPIETTNCECPCLNECTFVCSNQANMPELVQRIKDRYCTNSAWGECARYRVYQSLGAREVPPLMLPDQVNWARQVIEEYNLDSDEDRLAVEAE